MLEIRLNKADRVDIVGFTCLLEQMGLYLMEHWGEQNKRRASVGSFFLLRRLLSMELRPGRCGGFPTCDILFLHIHLHFRMLCFKLGFTDYLAFRLCRLFSLVKSFGCLTTSRSLFTSWTPFCLWGGLRPQLNLFVTELRPEANYLQALTRALVH